MRLARLSWLPVSILVSTLAGCDPSAGGPSIPPIPRTTAAQDPAPAPAEKSSVSATGKRSPVRLKVKTQTAPRTRTESE
jgi:hypothetical protein